MAYKFNPLIGIGLDDAGPSISALNLLGTVANEAALPGGATTGDVYQAEDTGVFYVWDGSAWDNLGTLAGPQGETGPAGPAGADGADGADGAPGIGLPPGGDPGQALFKTSGTDYDADWATLNLGDVADVDFSTPPADGEALIYDDATGTWVPGSAGGGGTPGGTDGQVQFNSSGSFAGIPNSSVDGTSGAVTLARLIAAASGAASTPPVALTGAWFTGGTATTTKPALLIEPTGTTSTSWSTSGTGLGVNAASGFTGNLIDAQTNGTSIFAVGSVGNTSTSFALRIGASSVLWSPYSGAMALGAVGSTPSLTVEGALGAGFTSTALLWWGAGAATGAYSQRDIALGRGGANVLKVTNGSTGTGYIKQDPVAVSALPSAATVGAGTRGFVNDATATTFASIVAGGGANIVPVYSDGTNWLIG